MAASIANQLECSICLEQYVEPKILPLCFHTFCLACLSQIEPEEEKIRCPECRTEHNLPIDGAKGFKNNFIVHKLINLPVVPSAPSLDQLEGQSPGSTFKPALESVPSAPPLDQYVAEKVSYDDVISEAEVLSFLEDLNLTELIDIFQKEELTMKDIQGMNNADLKDIGVKKFKHRKDILSACENLKKMVVPESPKPSSSTTKSIPQPSKSTNLDCQNCKEIIGIEVFYNTPTREYTHGAPEIYGHYQLQSEMVNGRVYFKKGDRGIWWDDGNGSWNVGFDSSKGTDLCIGVFINDVLCPHQITEWNGKLYYGKEIGYKDAGNSLALKCSIRVPCKGCPKGNGIEVFYNTPTQEYTYAPQIYGHYQLQSEMVNGRVYFKKGDRAIWWDGNDKWNIGLDSSKGKASCYGYFINDVLCPHQITEWNGKLTYGGKGSGFKDAGNSLCLSTMAPKKNNLFTAVFRKYKE